MKNTIVYKHIFALLTIFVCIIFVYWPLTQGQFINFDDDLYITRNPLVNEGFSLSKAILAFKTNLGGHWHPLTWIFHMVDCSLFGLDPKWHHLSNILLHSLSCCTLFLIVSLLSFDLKTSLFVSLFWGLWPMRLESVAWLSEKKDVLSMLLGLLSIYSYIIYTFKKFKFYYFISLIFFSLSLLSKPTFVTLPALLILFDFWPLYRKQYLEKIPYVFLSIAISLIAVMSQQHDGGLKDLSSISLDDRITNAFLSYLVYFGKSFLPSSYGIFYPFQRFAPGVGVSAFLVILIISYIVITKIKSSPWLTFGWGWLLISLLPMIGFIQIGGQSFADRWSYLPQIGLLIGAVKMLENSKYIKNYYLLVILLLLTAYITSINIRYWNDSISLWSHNLEVFPDNFMAHNNLGSAYDSIQNINLAGPHFEEAYRLNPTYPEAINNVGRLRATQNRLAEAQDLFLKAIRIRPNFTIALHNSALTFMQFNNPSAAAIQWLNVLSFEPMFPDALNGLDFILRNNPYGICPEKTKISSLLSVWNPTGYTSSLHHQLTNQLDKCG